MEIKLESCYQFFDRLFNLSLLGHACACAAGHYVHTVHTLQFRCFAIRKINFANNSYCEKCIAAKFVMSAVSRRGEGKNDCVKQQEEATSLRTTLDKSSYFRGKRENAFFPEKER